MDQGRTAVRTFDIAVLAGDGIGPEVMDAALRVLKHLQARETDLRLNFQTVSVGAEEYLRSGTPLPESALRACAAADAILLGAMGLPHVRWPNGRELTPQIDLREHFQLFRGERPVFLYHAADCPLKQISAGEIDFIVLRESTEGLFAARHQTVVPDADIVEDVLRVTRSGSERLFHAAFELARKRRGLVTLVDKANVLPSMVRFRELFDEVARQYPDVATERIYVDAAALFLIRRPQSFDVLVTENMFGDILSDLAAALVGGMGMAPSADIGPDVAVFQPCHGTAPDISGRGIANPIAMILSAAMMLEWLGTEPCQRVATQIRQAITRVLSNPASRTPDLGGTLSTAEITELILHAL
ncbi:MAG: 3-isopropylmalate dehydrogenase [Planctomycetota bacterium]